MAAGYAHPHVKGSQTLEKVSVREAIEALRLATTNPAIATREQRQVFWSCDWCDSASADRGKATAHRKPTDQSRWVPAKQRGHSKQAASYWPTIASRNSSTRWAASFGGT